MPSWTSTGRSPPTPPPLPCSRGWRCRSPPRSRSHARVRIPPVLSMADTGARLTILNGPLAGRELALGGSVDNILIGSDSSCRFHVASPGISPIHARIWMDGGGVTVYDTHSPRGLYINDNRVNGQAPLKNGDILWLGTPGEEEAVMIQVRLPGPGADDAAPTAQGTSS